MQQSNLYKKLKNNVLNQRSTKNYIIDVEAREIIEYLYSYFAENKHIGIINHTVQGMDNRTDNRKL